MAERTRPASRIKGIATRRATGAKAAAEGAGNPEVPSVATSREPPHRPRQQQGRRA